jgi:serine/threonine protein phosphatase PrpC
MTKVLADQALDASPIELARSLTDFARAAGGHDNITVVIIDLPVPDAGQKGSP